MGRDTGMSCPYLMGMTSNQKDKYRARWGSYTNAWLLEGDSLYKENAIRVLKELYEGSRDHSSVMLAMNSLQSRALDRGKRILNHPVRGSAMRNNLLKDFFVAEEAFRNEQKEMRS